ncbi:MAG: hypothetical protein ACJ0F6_00560 [Acidimicrobiales bacterium]
MELIRIRGSISSAGFAGGNRFVVGHWERSPIGPFGDVMWGTPDGQRILLAGNQEVADFVTSIYNFDDVRIGDLQTESDGRVTTVKGLGLNLHLSGGIARVIPFSRPLSFTRFIERPLAKILMGVETFGTSSRGVSEWYQARKWRWVKDGSVSVDGISLGSPLEFSEPINVGFSEPPARPAIVSLQVAIKFPSDSNKL